MKGDKNYFDYRCKKEYKQLIKEAMSSVTEKNDKSADNFGIEVHWV